MEKRLGFIGIIIEEREKNAKEVNAILSEYSDMILARMGIPYQEKRCNVITLVIDTDTDRLGELSGKLGNLPGVSVKSALSKTK